MRARLKDLALGSMAAGWLVAALWMAPAGEVLAAPSGETLPTFCWIRATTGYECPTCGLSRSFVSFFHGEPGHAFRFHPAGPLLAVATLMVLVAVFGLAMAGREPLSARPLFTRALTLVAGGALFAGVARLLAGGIG